MTSTKLTVRIAGMGCVDCIDVIENAVYRLPGVDYVGVSLTGGTMTLRADPGFNMEGLHRCVQSLGYSIVEGGVDVPMADACPCRGSTLRGPSSAGVEPL